MTTKRGRKLGPPPKPGDPHYRPSRHDHRNETVQHYKGVPDPTFLDDGDDDAQAMWRHVHESVPEAVLKAADTASLIMLCESWSDYRAARSAAVGNRSDLGLQKEVKPAFERVVKLLRLYGLDPVDRQKINILGAPPSTDVDPMAEQLGLTG